MHSFMLPHGVGGVVAAADPAPPLTFPTVRGECGLRLRTDTSWTDRYCSSTAHAWNHSSDIDYQQQIRVSVTSCVECCWPNLCKPHLSSAIYSSLNSAGVPAAVSAIMGHWCLQSGEPLKNSIVLRVSNTSCFT